MDWVVFECTVHLYGASGVWWSPSRGWGDGKFQQQPGSWSQWVHSPVKIFYAITSWLLLWRVPFTGVSRSHLVVVLPQLTRTPENMERMRCDVITSPPQSTRRLAQTLGIWRRSLQRICHKELKFHTYKIMVVQKLLPTDQKIQFNQPMLGVSGRWIQITIMSD